MNIPEKDLDYWMIHYELWRNATKQDSPTSNAGDGVDAVNKSCSILDIPIPQRTFTLPVFEKKHVVNIVV